MPTSEANPAKAGQIAQRIVEILADHDPETRQRAIKAAMMLLGQPTTALVDHERDPVEPASDHAALAELFARSEKLKPAEHAQLCAAFYYFLYGPVPFSLEEIRAIGADAGVVLPDRLDKTFKSATHNGKRLFQPAGRAAFKPTAAAGLAFIARWGVKPGRRPKANSQSAANGN
jgi:hypothetical protein